jgi:hypothetical protein
MNSFILILLFMNGYGSITGSTSVAGFSTAKDCISAGEAVKQLHLTTDIVKYTCVAQSQ